MKIGKKEKNLSGRIFEDRSRPALLTTLHWVGSGLAGFSKIKKWALRSDATNFVAQSARRRLDCNNEWTIQNRFLKREYLLLSLD